MSPMFHVLNVARRGRCCELGARLVAVAGDIAASQNCFDSLVVDGELEKARGIGRSLGVDCSTSAS